MMQDRIFARAVELTGEEDRKKQDQLRILCETAALTLKGRLREGVTPNDCGEAFVMAAALYAVAAAAEMDRDAAEFRAGDLTVKQRQDRETMARTLRAHGEELMGPYVKDRFLFTEV